MDKYTVDLDKVLNDFEYSELTEQNNGYAANASNTLASQTVFGFTSDNNHKPSYGYETLPYEAQTYPKLPNTTAKHSINNVFHSLNEYLNSDIKTDKEKPLQSLSDINEIEASIPTFVQKQETSSSVQNIFKNIVGVEETKKISNPNVNDVITAVSESRKTSYVSILSEDNPYRNIINLEENKSTHISSDLDDKPPAYSELGFLDGNLIEPLLDSSNNANGSFITHNLSSSDFNLTYLQPSSSNINSILANITPIVSVPNTESNLTISNPNIEPNLTYPKFSNSNLEIHNNLSDTNVPINIQNNKKPKEINVERSEIERIENDCNEDKNVLKPETDKYEEKQSVSQNLNVKENNIEKVIGFEEEFEVSDTEMENELAQLEEEYKEKIENEAQNLEKEELANVETDDIVDNKIEERFSVNEDVVDNEINERQENIEKESSCEEECNKNEGIDDEAVKTDTENSVQSIASSVDTFDNDVVNKNILEVNCMINVIEEDTLNDVQEVEVKEEVREETVVPLEMMKEREVSEERKKFALLRPNSLDLNAESPSENTSINLIGNPGSTPYNNVYVENSLETEDKQLAASSNPEAEANTSLSPTISEVSTSETSDSPNSSDSCNDTSLDDNLNDSGCKSDKTGGASGGDAREEGQEGVGDASGSQPGDSRDEQPIIPGAWLGKTAPFWTPDTDTLNCLHCAIKFTVLKRRHHCRACGLVLCSKCCNMKYKLEYLEFVDARVCVKCFEILSKDHPTTTASSGSDGTPESQGGSPVAAQARQLNPGNPMEYCSVVPPLQQVTNMPLSPPSVMVPVGVLKRKGSGKSRVGKSVMFCDGIRPGCDLTELDYDFNYKDSHTSGSGRKSTPPAPVKANRNAPKLDTKTASYIPSDENSLPPTVNVVKSETSYSDCANNQNVVEMLKNETLVFALQRNLHISVRVISMDCCINKQAWCFSTEGMISVGQDELVILLEFVDNEKCVPKDVFLHLNNIYADAVKGTSITEMGLSIHNSSNFLESKNHAGFLYVKPTFQCVQNVIIPKEPFLIGILIHRWETPWAKIFPLRLLLRLGAEYRYYPSPIISTRHRESVYVEIGHTIINLLADFRNFSYTLPNVRGLTIHMEEKNTTVSIPINRYDQVMKALNNSSDHILAFAANFSPKADSHLVCIQDTHGNNENAYTTHAINIHNKPRKVTGASFIVLNGALKSTSGLTAKSSIVEDGLMIQILPEQMVKLRSSLRNMKDFKINCGCVNAQSDEFVNITWTENDVNFNVGVVSPIDNMSLSGVPSIRVHNGRDYVCNSGNKMIRWTEVFIIQSGDENIRSQEPVDISKLSENISKATSQALVKYLDLLATNSFLKIGIRTTLHVENVSYLAGSNGIKLPPIYMKSLDNELIPILHKITSNNLGENAIVVELIFHILSL